MLAGLLNGMESSSGNLFVLRATTGEYYTGLSTNPNKKRSKALHFVTASEARTELSHVRSAGYWPLYDWKVVRVPKK